MLGNSKIPKWIIYLCCNWRTGFRPWRAWRISCSLKHTTPCGAKELKAWNRMWGTIIKLTRRRRECRTFVASLCYSQYNGQELQATTRQILFPHSPATFRMFDSFGEYFKMYVTSNKSICIFLNGELTQWTDAKKTLFSYSHLFRRVCQFSWQ